jgi:hypothetical protein
VKQKIQAPRVVSSERHVSSEQGLAAVALPEQVEVAAQGHRRRGANGAEGRLQIRSHLAAV